MKKIFSLFAAVLFAGSMMATNLTVAEVKTLIDNNKSGTDEVTVEGYVTAIESPADPTFMNVTFWMADAADGGKVLEIYRLSFKNIDADLIPVVGDKIAVTATFQLYNNSTYETKKIKSYEILVKGEGERYTAEDLVVEEITVAEAAQIASDLPDPAAGGNSFSKRAYKITGYVISCGAYDSGYKNQNFKVADTKDAPKGLVQFYRGKPDPEGAVAVGDKVQGAGLLCKHAYAEGDMVFQILNATVKVLERAQGIEDIVLTEKAQKVMVDGVVYIVRDGKMFNALGTQVR